MSSCHWTSRAPLGERQAPRFCRPPLGVGTKKDTPPTCEYGKPRCGGEYPTFGSLCQLVVSSIVLTAELPSIYVAEVSADEESYRAKVSAAIFAMRRRARMTQEEFALSLSRELGRE